MSGSHKSVIPVLLFALLCAFAAHAEEGGPVSLVPPALQNAAATSEQPAKPSIALRTGEHETYDRLVFDWPRHVPYKVLRNGTQVTVLFAAPAKTSLAQTERLNRARNFKLGNDGKGNLTVSFNVNESAVLKDFYSDNSVAIDIEGAAASKDMPPTPQQDTMPPEPAKPEAAAPAKPPSTVPVEGTTKKTKAAKNKTDQSFLEEAAKPTLPEAPAATPAALPPSPAPAEPVTTAASGTPALPQPPTPSPAPERQLPTINIGTKPVLAATLDPHIPLRAAVWKRAGYAYIVFDKKILLSLDEMTKGFPAPQVTLLPLDYPNNSGFRFALPDKVDVRAAHDGSQWTLYLSKLQPDVPVSSSLVAQPDFALGARYLLPLPDAPTPARITDPVLGDTLIVVPLSQTSAFSVARTMADFQILPAAQGLVIKPGIDKLVVRNVSDGLEITADGGLHMSKVSDTSDTSGMKQNFKNIVSGKSLFDFASWRGKTGETFTQTRQRLQQNIVDVDERERPRTRLELARFYFAHGMSSEALALFNYLVKDTPDLNAHGDFLALTGAAKIMSFHPDEGLKDLEAAQLPDQPEIKLWQAIGNAMIGNWTDAEEKFTASISVLSNYPEPFLTRFYVLAIESALAVGNDREAADWLNFIQINSHNNRANGAIEYLHGVLYSRAGQAQAAAQSWKVAAGSADQLYKTRAEMALIDLGVANKSISPAQAADRLEALRFAWRGDDLEADILDRLGMFYVKAKNIKSGLNVLSQALQLYPTSPMTGQIKNEMTQTFRDVFLGDLGKNLNPMESLAVYQQYKDTLMPTGDDGLAIMRSLAERLVAIDLIDQAADLLQELAKNRLKGEEKAHAVSRLAALRLLDHKPEKALDALDLNQGDALSETLQHERLLLKARALSQMHKEDEALALLKDQSDYPSKLLRADINLSARHWNDAAKTLIDLAGPPPAAGNNLSAQQSDWLVRAALSLALAGDQVGLDRLAIDYGDAMKASPQNNTFRILVEPARSGQLKDITAVQGRISEADMFQSFLDGYRKSAEDAPASAVPSP